MANRTWRIVRFTAAILMPATLVVMLILKLAGYGRIDLSNFPIAEPPIGDIAAYYDTRMAPLRQTLSPDRELGCCIDGLATRESMRGALQLEAVRFALLPAKVGKAEDYQYIVLDFDSEEQLQAAIPALDAQIVVRVGNGTGIARKNNFLPPSTAPKSEAAK